MVKTWLSNIPSIPQFYYFLVIILITTNYQASAQDITSGRIAFYPFNGNADDQVGSNHGTIYGATSVPDRFDVPNSAFYFDGVKDYIKISDHPSLNFAADKDFSISVWVKINNTQSDMGGTNNEILGKWNTQITSSYPYAIRYWNSSASPSNQERIFTLRYDSRSCNNNPKLNGACIITTEKWNHIVFLKKGNEISLFQDGVFQESTTDNTTLSCNTQNSNPIYVGKRDTDRRYFTGSIDDISFYNRALTRAEINILFEEGQWTAPSYRAELVSFHFPEQSSTSIIDQDRRTVEIEVPCGTDLTQLTATFTTSDGAKAFVGETIQESGYTPNNFTQTLTYTIEGEDACSLQEWDVIVNKKETSAEDADTNFLSFSLPEQTSPAFIDNDKHAILVEVSCTASLEEMTATFTTSDGAKAFVGETIQESGYTPNNFTQTLTYTIEGEDACSLQEWDIIVNKVEISTEEPNTNFLSFSLPEQTSPAFIDNDQHTILIEVSCTASLEEMTASFSLAEGAIGKVAGQLQKSGSTSNKFSEPLIYQVSNSKTCAEQDWEVKVSKQEILFESLDIRSEEFFLPNVITPNGDGNNDTFEVGQFFHGSELTIFNRHGKEILYYKNYSNQFNGEGLSPGTYFYHLISPCIKDHIKGYLLILF